MNKKRLQLHRIKITTLHKNAFHLNVTGREFYPHTINRVMPDGEEVKISKLDEVQRFYLGKEMVDLAVQAAYYTDTPYFSITVQRKGKELSITSLNEQSPIPKESPVMDQITFPTQPSLLGADIEVMVRKKNAGAYVALPFDDHYQSHLGTDRALIRKKNKFYQPIMELRATPQETGGELQQELLRLKEKLETKAKQHNVEIDANENPTGRFQLGGHLHISNTKATFRKVSHLDALVTIPLSAVKKNVSLDRRLSYGKLGAVRLNPFHGFEYRSLPTWYSYIEEGKPFFDWIQFIFFNESLPKIHLSNEVIHGYYNGDRGLLSQETEKLFKAIISILTTEENDLLNQWRKWLHHIETID